VWRLVTLIHMCKSDSSQRHDSREQLADFSKVCSNTELLIVTRVRSIFGKENTLNIMMVLYIMH